MSKIDDIQNELKKLAEQHMCKITELENVLYANYLLHTPKKYWEGLILCQQNDYPYRYTFCIDKKRIERCIEGAACAELRQKIQEQKESISALKRTIELLVKNVGDEDD